MAQRTGLIALATMAVTVRSGFAETTDITPPPRAPAARRSQMDRLSICVPLRATRVINIRRLAAVFGLGPQSKKSRSVPAGASNQDRDFGEIAVGIPVKDEPIS